MILDCFQTVESNGELQNSNWFFKKPLVKHPTKNNKWAEGQLISECLFDILTFPKKQREIWQISALEFKKLSNHKITAHYNDFD